MTRGHEEVSTIQAGRRRGTPRETPIASSLVAAMSTKELRLYNQILVEISLETSDDEATSTVGRQIMSSTLHWSSLLLGFASPFHCW